MVGQKRSAVQTVLDLAVEPRSELFSIVSLFGWEGAYIVQKFVKLVVGFFETHVYITIFRREYYPTFKKKANPLLFLSCVFLPGGPLTDDCLVSKKILPGYSFIKAGVKGITRNSPWLVRGRVTITSTVLLFQMIKAQHASSRIDLRKKLTRAQLEEKSAVCALACSLAKLTLKHFLCNDLKVILFGSAVNLYICNFFPAAKNMGIPTLPLDILHLRCIGPRGIGGSSQH